jgi:hypothetical protein
VGQVICTRLYHFDEHLLARAHTLIHMLIQGLITSLLTETPYSVSRFNDTMDELNEFMSSRGLNANLVAKLKGFYMLKFPTMRIYDEHSVFAGLPKGLSRAVKIELFNDVLMNSPIFYGMDLSLTITESGQQNRRSVAGDICARIETIYKMLGIEVTTAGEYPDALYIVRKGALAVLCDGKVLYACGSDKTFARVRIHMHAHVRTHMRMHILMHMHCYINMQIQTQMHLYVHLHWHINMQIYIYIYIYIYICICICIYICMYVDVH